MDTDLCNPFKISSLQIILPERRRKWALGKLKWNWKLAWKEISNQLKWQTNECLWKAKHFNPTRAGWPDTKTTKIGKVYFFLHFLVLTGGLYIYTMRHYNSWNFVFFTQLNPQESQQSLSITSTVLLEIKSTQPNLHNTFSDILVHKWPSTVFPAEYGTWKIYWISCSCCEWSCSWRQWLVTLW